MGVKRPNKVAEREWQSGPGKHCGESESEFEVLGWFETQFNALNEWLGLDVRRAN
jgi:hypothetical protein